MDSNYPPPQNPTNPSQNGGNSKGGNFPEQNSQFEHGESSRSARTYSSNNNMHNMNTEKKAQISHKVSDAVAICFKRLEIYLDTQRRRSLDNSLTYWTDVVELFYSPMAIKRWCLSKIDNVGRHVFNTDTTDSLWAMWRCASCGSKLEKGVEASYIYLPSLYQKNFEVGGVNEEILDLENPIHMMLPSRLIALVFKEAKLQSIYESYRVVNKGQLRIVFTEEYQIIYWEFCIHGPGDFVPLIKSAPQVNDLFAYVKNCHNIQQR